MLYMYQVTSPSVVSWLPTLKDQLHSQPYCLCSLRTPMRISCKMSHGTRQFKAQPQHTSPCRRDQHLAKLQRFFAPPASNGARVNHVWLKGSPTWHHSDISLSHLEHRHLQYICGRNVLGTDGSTCPCRLMFHRGHRGIV